MSSFRAKGLKDLRVGSWNVSKVKNWKKVVPAKLLKNVRVHQGVV
jgi:hypothetical protein